MNKRYQVFLSSTYADLQDERRQVIQTLMEMDCIPAGMELFPAMDEEQWAFIRKVIDDCDYYVLIIGGRYGSMTDDGVSYTEKEFDYAVGRGIKVVAFLHGSIDEISVGKSDVDPGVRAKLIKFREKVSTGRLVRFWKNAAELPGLVAMSLSKTITTYPAVGWVRGSVQDASELLAELNTLRKEHADLQAELISARSRLESTAEPLDLAPLEAEYRVRGSYQRGVSSGRDEWELRTTWKQVFALLAPWLLANPSNAAVESQLAKDLLAQTPRKTAYRVSLDDQVFQTIKIQLIAYGLVTVDYLTTTSGGAGVFWALTKSGRQLMMSLRTVKGAQS